MLVMSGRHVRSVVITCEQINTKMQATADILVLPCLPYPIRSENVVNLGGSFDQCVEQTQQHLDEIKTVTHDLTSKLHNETTKWLSVRENLNRICSHVNEVLEFACHAGYVMAIQFADCRPAQIGVVDRYVIKKANLDIDMGCMKMRQALLDDMTPQFLVDTCGELSKNLTVLTEICRFASNKINDPLHQDQFKLCMKSVTSTTSCLISSVKLFKEKPSLVQQGHCVAFGEAVVSSVRALTMFAADDEFTGIPASLTPEAKDAFLETLSKYIYLIKCELNC